MKKSKLSLLSLWILAYRALPILCLVGILCLTVVSTVYADGGGPQGGSNSGGAPPPPPPPPPSAGWLAYITWFIKWMLGL